MFDKTIIVVVTFSEFTFIGRICVNTPSLTKIIVLY